MTDPRPEDEPAVDALLARLDEALRSDDPIGRVRAVVSGLRPRPAGEPPPGPSLAEAARLVRAVVGRAHAHGGRVVLAPLVPVIGLPGSGKTSFLARLGEVLLEQRARFHFPYAGDLALEPLALDDLAREAGIASDEARALESRVVDLGREGREGAAAFRRASFPDRTAPGTGARFLVGALRKDGAPYARLVSFDAAGEDLLPIFRAGRAASPLEDLARLRDDPGASGVAARALDDATGAVLLVDATRPLEWRGSAHAPLLELLARAVRPRARAALLALAADLEAEERRGERRTLEGALLRLRRSQARYGEELCLELEAPLLRALAESLDAGDEPLERADLRAFLRDLAALPGERPLVEAIGARLVAGLRRPEGGRRALEAEGVDGWMRAAARLRGVPVEVARRLATAEVPAGAPELFPRLRGLSIVETKADAGRPVSPFALPGCATALEEIRGALRLLGGDLRTYEASVTGYVGLRGARWTPGPFATQTPVNVVEPVFDLLGIPRDDGARGGD